MKKIRLPEWKDVEGSKRISQQTMLKSITSLTQALVELITNVDDAYERLNHKINDFPVSYSNQRLILSLPLFPEITESQLNRVILLIENFYKD